MLIVPGVGERLRGERDRLGLNQTDFGAAAGVSRGTQKAYELESSSPDIRYLSALHDLGVDVCYVLTGGRAAAAAEGLSADEAQLLEHYRLLPTAVKASVAQLATTLANPAGE